MSDSPQPERSEIARLTKEVAELTHYIDTLVASSIATHLILKTPSETMSLQESAQRVMDRLALPAHEQPPTCSEPSWIHAQNPQSTWTHKCVTCGRIVYRDEEATDVHVIDTKRPLKSLTPLLAAPEQPK